MSILIRGMEMPKNRKDCPFSDHEAWCLIPGDWRERYYCPDNERSEYCPLIELPPHGRLGDLDELYKVANMADDFGADTLDMLKLIADTPTVIEAEGSET